MEDLWRVNWIDQEDREQSRTFREYLAAWTFNEEVLKGRGEVTLVTDRPLSKERSGRSEADQARSREGNRRRSRRTPN